MAQMKSTTHQLFRKAIHNNSLSPGSSYVRAKDSITIFPKKDKENLYATKQDKRPVGILKSTSRSPEGGKSLSSGKQSSSWRRPNFAMRQNEMSSKSSKKSPSSKKSSKSRSSSKSKKNKHQIMPRRDYEMEQYLMVQNRII